MSCWSRQPVNRSPLLDVLLVATTGKPVAASRASLSLKEIRGIFAHLEIVEVVKNVALASIVPTYRRSRCPAGRDNR